MIRRLPETQQTNTVEEITPHPQDVIKGNLAMFHLVACNMAVLAIAMIYYAWKDGHLVRNRRRAQLHDRVAYMLWEMAQRTN